MPKRKEVKIVKLTPTVDEAMWRKLRHAAEEERGGPRGRASVNALLQQMIVEYFSRRGGN